MIVADKRDVFTRAQMAIESIPPKIIGVSGNDDEEDIADVIAKHYNLPLVSDLIQKVLHRDKKWQSKTWSFNTMLDFHKDLLDELEVALIVHSGGVVFDRTPMDSIAPVLLKGATDKRSQKECDDIEWLTQRVIYLCGFFTHFVQVFPKNNRSSFREMNAHITAGFYHRYHNKIGKVMILIPEVLSRFDDKVDFAIRVLDLL